MTINKPKNEQEMRDGNDAARLAMSHKYLGFVFSPRLLALGDEHLMAAARAVALTTSFDNEDRNAGTVTSGVLRIRWMIKYEADKANVKRFDKRSRGNRLLIVSLESEIEEIRSQLQFRIVSSEIEGVATPSSWLNYSEFVSTISQ
ncbi:hypothetical protein LJR098_001046 [Rhizobium sp. LjRoot98]|uniref:hypothetical protein n=1 Tax=Rhizobium sp. LjRoot98 TaxID=3342345 RepID=UPI003ECD66AE